MVVDNRKLVTFFKISYNYMQALLVKNPSGKILYLCILTPPISVNIY